MYPTLLLLHSILRWIVLLALITAIVMGIRGLIARRPFSKPCNTLRHTTATLAHIQLVLGYLLYFNSPFIRFFREHYKEAVVQFDYVFFGIIHIILMTIAVLLITAGSSLAKRRQTSPQQFRTMTLWFAAALLLILIAIPWPFSPLAQRPYFRPV